jgi:hypothetical protein
MKRPVAQGVLALIAFFALRDARRHFAAVELTARIAVLMLLRNRTPIPIFF